MAASLNSQRIIGQRDRSCIKIIASRRFRSSLCSNQEFRNVEEAIFKKVGDKHLLSYCAEEIPTTEIVCDVGKTTSSEPFESPREHCDDSGGRQHRIVSPNDLSSLQKLKRSNDHSNAQQNGSTEAFSLPSSYIEECQNIRGKNSDEQGEDNDIDFVDMAISRDARDLAVHRANSNHVSSPIQVDKEWPKLGIYHPKFKFGRFDMLGSVLSIILFYVDIATDIQLAVHYYTKELWVYSAVTCALVFVPSLVTCCLGLHWYVNDYKAERAYIVRLRNSGLDVQATPNSLWFLRFTFTLLQLGPVIRSIEYQICGYLSRKKAMHDSRREHYHKLMLHKNVDILLLRMFESFFESAPQLTWQLYIVIVSKPPYDIFDNCLTIAAHSSSWGSLAISLVSYHKSLRISHEDKAKMTKKSLPIYLIWRASEVAVRIICIAMFASTFHLWVLLPLLLHWTLMSSWLISQKTTFYHNKCLERAFNIICGYVMIFCFLNLKEGISRFRFLFFYSCTYVESFFMLGLWFHFSPDIGAWFHFWGFISVLILFCLHIVFQLLYYIFFHPSCKVQICLHWEHKSCWDTKIYEKRVSRVNTEPNDSLDVEIVVNFNEPNVKNHRPSQNQENQTNDSRF